LAFGYLKIWRRMQRKYTSETDDPTMKTADKTAGNNTYSWQYIIFNS
jgi:hypothetical protein